MFNGFAILILVLIAARCLAQFYLDFLNRGYVRKHSGAIPLAFRGMIDDATYRKSVEYTLAKSQISRVEILVETVVLCVVLFSGILPWAYQRVSIGWGDSIWAAAAYLWMTGAILTLPALPIEWYAQFRLEERFGFNSSTFGTWCMDRVKGFVLALLIGYPLLALLLKVISWTGSLWWLWAWVALTAFQLLMMVLAPVIILPLFNKFTPLPEGGLRDRLLQLAQRTGFQARNIQVMDGSKRSRHSNAFFTGFGKFRRIVLFDTLIQQLLEPELEAVLAHEIGHYQKKHILRFLIASVTLSLAAFWLLSLLAGQPWFYEAFGFKAGRLVPALLVFTLLSGLISFWLGPLLNYWSRRFEYEADAFAAAAMQEPTPLTSALRKLNEKNLSNLTPHPIYSGFYYSHPTLLERETALQSIPPLSSRPG